MWTAERLDVTHAHSGFYGGEMNLTYSMAPLNRAGVPPSMRLDTTYTDVDLGAFSDAMEMKGLRLSGRATGRNLLEWRSGHWEEHHGEGEITAAPPAGVTLQGPVLSGTRPEPSFAHVYGDPFPPLGRVPIGGSLPATPYGPEWVDVAPGRIASPTTFVEFDGRTAYGDRSRVPFHVTSSDWQQSARELAGIITAFGSPTRPAELGGAGTFDGVLLNAFWNPRIEGLLKAAHMSVWDVDWGSGESHVVVENLYADVTDGVVRKGAGTLRAKGRFALGYPRKDHGEEINAVFTGRQLGPRGLPSRVRSRQATRTTAGCSANSTCGAGISSPSASGGSRWRPVSAYEETATSASASLRFDGPGVWLDGIDIRKGETGIIRGAAHVEWLGTYSFNADAQNIPVESIDMVAFPEAPLTGRLDFTAAGSGDYLHPTYDADFRVRDLYVKDEGIGDVKGRLELRGDDANFSFDGNSSRLAASGAGKVTLLGDYPGDVTLRLTDASLDPYARVFMPGLSPFATAVASGTVRISGTLLSLDNIVAKVQVDALAVKLFDYGLQNEGAIDASLEQGILRIGRFTLSGENTRLSLNGNVDVVQGILGAPRRGRRQPRHPAGLHARHPRIGPRRGDGGLHGHVRASRRSAAAPSSPTAGSGTCGCRTRSSNINGRVVFAGSSIRFDDVTAKIGGGDVRFGGRVGLAGLWPSQFEITATGENMELRYPDGFRSIVDADLGLRGTLEDPVLSGTVLVRRAEMRRSARPRVRARRTSPGARAAGPRARQPRRPPPRSRSGSTSGSPRRPPSRSTTSSRG